MALLAFWVPSGPGEVLIQQALPKVGQGALVLSKKPLLQNPALTAVAKANQALIHHILLYQAHPASSEIPPERAIKIKYIHTYIVQ